MPTIYSKKILLFIGLLIFTATNCHAGPINTKTIKIFFGYKFPPFYTATSKKEPSKSLHGIFIDMLQDFQKQHPEYKIEYKCLPKARITNALAKGKADAFALTAPMFMSTETKERYTTSLPMWTMSDHLLVRKDSKIVSADLDDMIGKTITVLHGNSYSELDKYFEKGLIKKHAVYSTKLMLNLLLKHRVDAAVCNKQTLPGLIKQTNFSMEDFIIIKKPLFTYRLHLLVNRANADFLHEFNNFIKSNPLPVFQKGG
ncbi:substrate-binding periplasmic protein [Maridesulfovibrio sp.]|uniref:substrate-binding periplasmic protein n=1 Tax=Maridesulfovibrio sp. TaxID=2795000 RepID=UPI0039F06699